MLDNYSNKIHIITILFIFSLSYTYAQSADSWVLTKDENGVKIYTRHNTESPIKEVKGVMELQTSLSSLVALVKDAENQHNWVYLNKVAYLLDQPSDFEWYYYNESDAPWPVTNRDIVTHAKLSQNPKTYTVKIRTNGIPNYIPVKDGIVRILKLKSSWDFIPLEDGIVKVEFRLFIDLGGNLPAWAINLAVDTGPFNTMSAMTEEIKRDKYRNAKRSFIKEKP